MSATFWPRFSVFTFLLAALSAGLKSPLPAAELRFNNGDRLTGQLISQENGQIRFLSPALGEVVVLETLATVVDEPEMPVESLTGLPPPQPAPPPPAAAPPAAQAPKAAAVAPEPSRWRGKVEFGFQQQSGSSESIDFSLRMDAERKSGRDQYRANGRLLYGEKNDKRSSDRYDASFRWRRDFSNRVFSQTLSTFLADRIKQIDESYEQNLGIGYRFLDREQHIVNAGVGATGRYRDAVGTDQNFQLLGEVFEDYTYKINGRFTFLQNALLQWSTEAPSSLVQGRQNYKVQFDTALQGRLTDRMSLNLRFEHEFDNAVVNREARTDQRLISSLGYAF